MCDHEPVSHTYAPRSTWLAGWLAGWLLLLSPLTCAAVFLLRATMQNDAVISTAATQNLME